MSTLIRQLKKDRIKLTWLQFWFFLKLQTEQGQISLGIEEDIIFLNLPKVCYVIGKGFRRDVQSFHLFRFLNSNTL